MRDAITTDLDARPRGLSSTYYQCNVVQLRIEHAAVRPIRTRYLQSGLAICQTGFAGAGPVGGAGHDGPTDWRPRV